MRPRDHVAGESTEPSRKLHARERASLLGDEDRRQRTDDQPADQLQDAGYRDGRADDHPAQREDGRVGRKEVADCM